MAESSRLFVFVACTFLLLFLCYNVIQVPTSSTSSSILLAGPSFPLSDSQPLDSIAIEINPSNGRPPPPKKPSRYSHGAANADADRPLITYVYSESAFGRINLQFFVKHGLHSAADFIFILNGPTDVDEKIIPKKVKHVRVIKRSNTCFDLGAHAVVLNSVVGRGKLRDRYKRFILMNASIRGPLMPHWSRECWSDAYLSKLNDKVRLVGSTINCHRGINQHVQSMIWATDSTGLDIILTKEGINDCFPTLQAAMNAEVRTTPLIRSKGYEVDVMLSVYQTVPDYKYVECKDTDDFLYEGAYFGFTVHPFETLFVKSGRGMQENLLQRLSEWQTKSNYSSYDVCNK